MEKSKKETNLTEHQEIDKKDNENRVVVDDWIWKPASKEEIKKRLEARMKSYRNER